MIAVSLLAIDESYYGLIEMALVFGLVLGLALRELLSVRKALRDTPPPKDTASDRAEDSL